MRSLILSLFTIFVTFSVFAADESINPLSGIKDSDLVEVEMKSFNPINLTDGFGKIDLILKVSAYYTGEGLYGIHLCGDSYVTQIKLGYFDPDKIIEFKNKERVFLIEGSQINNAVKKTNFSKTCTLPKYKLAGLRFSLYENDFLSDDYLTKTSINLPSVDYIQIYGSNQGAINEVPTLLTIDSSDYERAQNTKLEFTVSLQPH